MFDFYRSEYKTILTATLMEANTVVSYDLTSRIAITLIVVFVSVVYKLPLRPAQLFVMVPFIFIIVETLIWRCIYYHSMFIAQVRVTAKRIEVIIELNKLGPAEPCRKWTCPPSIFRAVLYQIWGNQDKDFKLASQ